MIIEKTITVKSPACDLCERPTKRRKWQYGYNYLFCDKHKWVETIMTTIKQNCLSNPTLRLNETTNFLKGIIDRNERSGLQG